MTPVENDEWRFVVRPTSRTDPQLTADLTRAREHAPTAIRVRRFFKRLGRCYGLEVVRLEPVGEMRHDASS